MPKRFCLRSCATSRFSKSSSFGFALAVTTGLVLASSAPVAAEVCHPTPRGPSPLPYRQGFERDHIVPLCLGGADDPSNMEYQVWSEARAKDRLEATVCRMVCDQGSMDLRWAQNAFRSDWRALYVAVFDAAP